MTTPTQHLTVFERVDVVNEFEVFDYKKMKPLAFALAVKKNPATAQVI
jgi:hypothetical protein